MTDNIDPQLDHNLLIHLTGKIVSIGCVSDGYHIVFHTKSIEDIYLCSKGLVTVQVQPSPHEEAPFKYIPTTYVSVRQLEVARIAESFTKTAQKVDKDFIVEVGKDGWYLRDLQGRCPEVQVWDRKQVRRLALQMLIGLVTEVEMEDFDKLFPPDMEETDGLGEIKEQQIVDQLGATSRSHEVHGVSTY